MKKTMLQITGGIFAALLLCGCGCDTNKAGTRIKMAEGSLSVKNESRVDVFPVVQAKTEEDFGGVSAGASKMIGFASVDADKVARVVWAEGQWDGSKKTVAFSLKVSSDIAEQTKHIEFCYAGKDRWVLNLYKKSPPKKDDVLTSVPGQRE
jgi:hypothetical protein